jgi:enoyl-CoA hydratase
MSSRESLLVELRDRIATLTLNRPERRNALDRALYQRLPEVVRELDASPEVDVVILTGSDPAFCAGVDLKELAAAPPTSAGEGRSPWRGPLPPIGKPIIGAINGVATTGGLELALACDFLVASERAAFADTHARVGILPGDGLTVRLAEAVGVRRAKEMSLSGNFVSARQAFEWGLVNHVVPHDELLPFARKLAQDLVANDQAAVRQMKDTYEQESVTTAGEAWEIEDRISREWERRGYDAAELERRRRAVVERGRSQSARDDGPAKR